MLELLLLLAKLGTFRNGVPLLESGARGPTAALSRSSKPMALHIGV